MERGEVLLPFFVVMMTECFRSPGYDGVVHLQPQRHALNARHAHPAYGQLAYIAPTHLCHSASPSADANEMHTAAALAAAAATTFEGPKKDGVSFPCYY